MAHAVSSPPILRTIRSAQSGSKAMTAAYSVVYTDSTISAMAYLFMGAEIDLSSMAAGDVIDVRVRKIVVAGGAWINHSETQYVGAQPSGHVGKRINPITDAYGIEISMRQTAGVLRTIDTEFYYAKRIGTS